MKTFKVTATPEFRDYIPRNYSSAGFDNYLCLNTASEFSVVCMELEGNALSGELDADAARELGTLLIRYAGMRYIQGGRTVFCTDKRHAVRVYFDGEKITFALCDDGKHDYIDFVISEEDAIDIGHRLIAKAGPVL